MFDKLASIYDEYQELSESISHEEIIRDYPRYQSILKKMTELKPVVDQYEQYLSLEQKIHDTEELLHDPDLADEAEAELTLFHARQEELLSALKMLLVPSDPMDSRNVILEIRAGVGGEEAALFAGDLLRMYQKYADKSGLRLELLSLSKTDLGGVNEALMMISGHEAYARLKFESGIHCVKRVPVTESSGRIHTSTATVAVLPEAEDMELTINPADLRIDVFHASGHGGQGVNTTDSAVRITHLPTGTVVTCQDERSQLENKAKAIKVLRSRLLEEARAAREAETASSRSSQIKQSERSERIRTYYFNHDYVVDHRVNMTLNRTVNFLNGELAPLIDALRLAEKTSLLNQSS
ncbi:MAG: peptide chain release factor 1 [Clostridia bacterium]|nr:peptide chain release factor 1 [Clostridia bacterium]